jgi:hypothetical protein
VWFPDTFQGLQSLFDLVGRSVTRSVHQWFDHHRHQLAGASKPIGA